MPTPAGPTAEVKVPGETVDWEAELVVVVGQEIHDVDEDAAQAAIAGYSVGQDFSERTVQRRPPAPQFSLGKSFPGFGPFGPAVVSPDELEDPARPGRGGRRRRLLPRARGDARRPSGPEDRALP